MTGNLFRTTLLIFLLTASVTLTGQAQEDALLSPFDPSLGLAMPLRQGDEQVLVTQKFLLNHNVIISAGDQLRVIFPRPEVIDRDVRMKNSRKNLENTFSRQPSKIGNPNEEQTQSAIYRAALDRATKTVWKHELFTRGYLDRMELTNNILVFQHPGAEQLTVDLLSFPQDLFLGETDGQIVVLAVRKGSQSQQLGIGAGATLTAMSGQPFAGLEDFRDRYFDEKQHLIKQNQPLTMTFILKGETAPRDITYKLPRSLSGNLLMMDLPKPNAGPQHPPEKDSSPKNDRLPE
ncbi:MAG: hypothetical protein LBK76_05605 [Verrucomicrobiales bacterium]|jgi:hypothetical protein|nr:hypothetical protein [Verrucomicrobiales bacterium]